MTLEVTRNLLIALRLAGLVRRTLGMEPFERVGDEAPTGGGCLLVTAMVFAELAVVAAGVVVVATGTERHLGADGVPAVGVIAVGTALAMIAVQHLLALPMRRAMRGHVLANLGIERP